MGNQAILISEAKLSASISLAVIPIALVVVVSISELLGWGLENSMFYRLFGPLIYVLFFGGAAYAFYEFIGIVRGRSHYLTYRDGCLRILKQGSIKLDQIKSLTIERKLFWKSLVIKTHRGRAIRIRGYLLQRNLDEIKSSIEMLQRSESA